LIEGASTNLLLRSEEFDNAAWTKVRNAITANATVAPDGNTTADASISSADNNNHRTQQPFTFAATTTYTKSCFVKAADKTVCYLTVEFSDPNANTVYFDLSTGAVGTVKAGLDGATIESFGNGWFRITATRTTTTGGASFAHVSWAEADDDPVFAGDGATIDGYNWGAQLEAIQFSSSYIPTTTTSVTKALDDNSVAPSNIPVPTADYTVHTVLDVLGLDSTKSQILFNVDGETARRIAVNTTTGLIEATHGAVTSVSTTAITPGTPMEITFTVGGTNQTLYIDKAQEDQDVKGTVTGTATRISLGNNAGADQIFANFTPITIFREALTDAQQAAL
jgi:hypothetical protein